MDKLRSTFILWVQGRAKTHGSQVISFVGSCQRRRTETHVWKLLFFVKSCQKEKKAWYSGQSSQSVG